MTIAVSVDIYIDLLGSPNARGDIQRIAIAHSSASAWMART